MTTPESKYPLVQLRHLSAIPITNGLGEAGDPANDADWPRYIRTTDIAGVRALDPSKRVTLPPAVAEQAQVLRGDILMTSAGTVGKSYLHQTDEVACFAGYLSRLRLRTDRALPEFIAYWTESAHFQDQVQSGAVKSTIENFSAAKYRAMWSPAPELDTQRAIADYLDRETAQIDAFIAKNQELIALLGERRSAAVTQAVTAGVDSGARTSAGQSTSIDGFPEHWDVLQLRHLLRSIDQGVSPQADAGLAVEGRWGVLKSGCVNGGIFRPEEHKALPPDFLIDPAIVVRTGDLLLNRASGSVSLLGSAALVESNPFKLILSDKTFRLLANSRVHTAYLYWWLNSRLYREQITATVSGADGLANNLPMAKLRGFVVPLPPKTEQAEIVRHLSVVTAAADRAIQAARRAISLADERRAALISAAVTGKIDVGVAA